jgi:hypothetical protein
MTPVFGFLCIPKCGATMAQATVVDDLYLPALKFEPLTEIINFRRLTQRIDGRARLQVEFI